MVSKVKEETSFSVEMPHFNRQDSMIDNLNTALIGLREGASDEKGIAQRTIQYYIDCLKTGKLKVKWTIS